LIIFKRKSEKNGHVRNAAIYFQYTGRNALPAGQRMKISYEDELCKIPEEVFPWIADPSKAMRWQKNVKSGEILIQNPGVIGTTFKEIIEENGKSLEMYGTITEYEKDKIIGFNIESRIHKFNVSYIFESLGEKTKLFIKAEIEWKFPMNVISFFMHSKIAAGLIKQLRSEVRELKNLCACS